MENRITRHFRRTSRKLLTTSVLFSMVVLAVNPGGGCQNSWTPKPNCPAGWHVEHAPSHQGHVWDCVRDNGSGRVPNGVFPSGGLP